MSNTLYLDGFYINHDESRDLNLVLRFYQDYTVIIGAITQPASGPVALPTGNWFRAGAGNVNQTTFRLVGNHLEFTLRMNDGTSIAYIGEINDDGLGLRLSTSEKGQSEVVHTFYYMPFRRIPDYIP